MTSEQIRKYVEQKISKGELELPDTVKLFEHIGKDVLKVKTRAAYGRAKGKVYNAHQFAKGARINLSGTEFIVDCE